MRWRVCVLGRTAIYVHLGTLVCGAYFAAVGYGGLFLVSMLSIAVHEACHGLIGLAFSVPPAEMEMTPLGAVMRMEDESALPRGKRLLMLLAGPCASLGLCRVFLAATRWGWIPADVGRMGFSCNLLLALGNLLPVLPLDGGRVLVLWLELCLRRETVKKVMRFLGTAAGLLLVGLNVYLSLRNGGWNFSCGMVGCFIMYAAYTSTTSPAMAEMRMFVERKHRLYRKGGMNSRWVALLGGAPLRQAVNHLHPAAYTMFAVVQAGSGHVLKLMGEDEIIAAYLREPGGRVLSD